VGHTSPTRRVVHTVPASNCPTPLASEGAIGYRIVPAGLRWTGQPQLKYPGGTAVQRRFRSCDLSERHAPLLSVIKYPGRPLPWRLGLTSQEPTNVDLEFPLLIHASSARTRAMAHNGLLTALPCNDEKPPQTSRSTPDGRYDGLACHLIYQEVQTTGTVIHSAALSITPRELGKPFRERRGSESHPQVISWSRSTG